MEAVLFEIRKTYHRQKDIMRKAARKRWAKLSREERSEFMRKAVQKRWAKKKGKPGTG